MEYPAIIHVHIVLRINFIFPNSGLDENVVRMQSNTDKVFSVFTK